MCIETHAINSTARRDAFCVKEMISEAGRSLERLPLNRSIFARRLEMSVQYFRVETEFAVGNDAPRHRVAINENLVQIKLDTTGTVTSTLALNATACVFSLPSRQGLRRAAPRDSNGLHKPCK